MNILVFEYITGGGLIGEDLPCSLAAEGDLMRQALCRDLAELSAIEVTVSRDYRLPAQALGHQVRVVPITPNAIENGWFDALMHDCDAVWPIIPETGGLLEHYCSRIQATGKLLLSSPAPAVRVCGDKLLTCDVLLRHAIPCVPATTLPPVLPADCGRWVVKSRDGAGCSDSHIVATERDYGNLLSALPNPNPGHYLLQPFVAGQPASLSCLFKHGRAALLSYNEQIVEIHGNAFELNGCIVNAPCSSWKQYRHLAEQVAQALPDLWGYAGIDLIVTDDGPLVLEINPRLTTSYTGLRQALQINAAQSVLALQHADLPQTAASGRPVMVSIAKEKLNGE